jgi:electron transfer flavoprotein beta subunit
MNLVCLVKCIPDVGEITIDPVRHVLVRENLDLVINPEDAMAVACALSVKRRFQNIRITVVSMGPPNAKPLVEDLLRLGVDHAVFLCDQAFGGSDTFATSTVLAKALQSISFDWILTGTHTLDGDTAHVPAQIAHALALNHLSHITAVDFSQADQHTFVVDCEDDHTITRIAIDAPSILSFSKEAPFKLPYVAYDDLNLDVSDRLDIKTHLDLGLSKAEIGFEGSKTKVINTFVPVRAPKAKIVVQLTDDGIDTVIDTLTSWGYLA